MPTSTSPSSWEQSQSGNAADSQAQKAQRLSEQKLIANRRNAQKSTGPRTVEGKARSSKNAMKHGLCSADIVVEGEDRQDYRRYRVELLRWTEPRNDLELEFAEQIIRSGWKLRRYQAAEQYAYRDRRKVLQSRQPNIPVGIDFILAEMLWDDLGFSGLQRYERQQTGIMNRAMDQLRKMRKDEQHGILNDFTAHLIEEEREQIENEQNEATEASSQVSDEMTESSATDGAPMNTDEGVEEEVKFVAPGSEVPPEGFVDG